MQLQNGHVHAHYDATDYGCVPPHQTNHLQLNARFRYNIIIYDNRANLWLAEMHASKATKVQLFLNSFY
jgi:hypothetical protein